jgi:hypothetical protein
VREVVFARLRLAFGLYRDLVVSLPEEALALRLPELPSNSVGSQLWCVVGARESYVRAVLAGKWQGFACRVTKAESKQLARVAAALAETAALAERVLADESLEWTGERQRLLVTLLEHEAQHHGQLIRYLYANRLEIPASWKERYALD